MQFASVMTLVQMKSPVLLMVIADAKRAIMVKNVIYVILDTISPLMGHVLVSARVNSNFALSDNVNLGDS